MEIKQIKIEELKPADYNPRQMTEVQYKHLKESLEKFGLVDPIIVNKHEGRENIVIGGHQRLTIARELGFKEVPVSYVDLNEEDEKELNIRLNKNNGQWDFDKLANNFSVDGLLKIGWEKFELGFFGDESLNAKEMYKGMPGFENDEISFRAIIMHFKNQEDVDKFGELVGQKITEKGKSYWYPSVPNESRKDKRYNEE